MHYIPLLRATSSQILSPDHHLEPPHRTPLSRTTPPFTPVNSIPEDPPVTLYTVQSVPMYLDTRTAAVAVA